MISAVGVAFALAVSPKLRAGDAPDVSDVGAAADDGATAGAWRTFAASPAAQGEACQVRDSSRRRSAGRA